jgi:hypothetical protein
MPPVESDMAAHIFKDPYLFDFLGTADPRREREVEQALVGDLNGNRITRMPSRTSTLRNSSMYFADLYPLLGALPETS